MRCRWVSLVLLTAGCASAATLETVSPASDRLAVSVAADALGSITIDGRDGQLDVSTTETDSVRIRVRLAGRCGEDAGFALRTGRAGTTLSAKVEPSTKDRCDEHWTVEIPAALRVAAQMDRADVRVDGVGGGVELDIGNGTVRVAVPQGDLRAHVEKGDVIAVSRTRSPGRIRVEAEVGRVELRMFGGLVRHTPPPGPGDWIAVDGSGVDDMSVTSTVGNATLVVGARD